MKQPLRLILLTLLTCSLAVPVSAEENSAAGTHTVPPAAPAQKTAEPAATQQPTRLGYVDISRIATESETSKAGQAELDVLKKKLQGQIEDKQKQLGKQEADIKAKLNTYTAKQREAKIKEFQKKLEALQKFGQNAEKQLQDKQAEFSEKIFKAVEQASADLGKAKGLALVVIKRELLYLGSGVDAQDVTDEVIRQIDKK
jgi:outer membrane protein